MNLPSSVIGHQKTLKDLKQLISDESLGQSYLFYGPSMVGKKTLAIALAYFLEKGKVEIPGKGEVLQDCIVIDREFMKNVNGSDRESIGIDMAREARNFLFQRPISSPRRMLIIDDADMLTVEAQNALLKITEEPPASSLIIFITSDVGSILETILSRVQKIYFGLVPQDEVMEWLVSETGRQNSKKDKSELVSVTKKAFGKPGLAWRLAFDEVFKNDIGMAQKFLNTTTTERRDFIKELIAPDDFSLRHFLSLVTLVLAWQKESTMRNTLWHKTLALEELAGNFGVNPRIQLENLFIG